ncbi:MAG TPA: hypothetical protein VFW59_03565 [Gallionella sp.]|nr:hypothetical protein [Gallionella sp.]
MKNALLLLLSANHLHAQLIAGGKITAQQEFSDTPESRNEFTAFVSRINHPAYLLVDLIEEDFRQETIPHLIGSSRNALLQRKFEQFYRNTPFRQATLLQRQKTGRRDDDMLFSALTNPALITPWLNILLAQKVPLAGIYSVPQLSAPLIEDHPSDYLLLISWEKSAGLRQTFFSQHRLQISRLTPINADQTFQDAVLTELPRTFQYLKSLSLLPGGQTLDVRLLGHRSDLSELKAALPVSLDMRYDFVELIELARRHCIEQHCTDSDASQIFLHHLAAKPPQTHYANANHIHYYTLWRLRHALNWISAALLLGALTGGMIGIWQGGWNTRDARAMNGEAQKILNEARQITDTFPNTHVPASDMKASVSIMHDLERQTLQPETVMRPLSNVLDRYPQIELDELEWAMDTVPNTASGTPPQVITLKGRLVGFASNYRRAFEHLKRFGRDLEIQGYHVTVLSEPLDISPSGSIADRREATPDALDFSLKLLRRPPT